MRRLAALALACAALLVSVRSAPAQALIEGTVDLARARAAAPPASKPRYAVAASHEIGPPDPPAAVVYLEGTFAAGARTTPPPAQMAQHHYQFAPGLLPIQRGGVVRFPNLDDEYHSVFSYSKVKRFDLGRYHKDETPAELTFDQAGVVRLYCEIHDHMRGTILVLDTPYFQKTDSDGRYRLEHLPAGRYLLTAWLEDGTAFERPVELQNDTRLHVDFPEKE
jgi:plastocyanin